ncbi:hypothetical protein VE03_00333 [Pseudogymnoascus sp. 23342-1-I1]|nr:hypothetical protein VE03_00333 [Pseudogymnoascus sp. 23342-1-I1]
MSSMQPHNFMSADHLDESPAMGQQSLYYDQDEPLFPVDGNMLGYSDPAWANQDDMTGNSTSAQPWPAPAEMARNDSAGTTESHPSNQQYSLSGVAPAQTQTTALPSVELPLPSVEVPLKTSLSPSPEASKSPRDTRTRKRKTSPLSEEDEDDSDTPETPTPPPARPPPKKTAHNMIEKRYRTNLNDKIAELKQSVPSLRATEKNLSGKGNERKVSDMMEDLEGLSPPNKLNKATILAKATEYIIHLERRNQALISEKSALIERINTFENLMLARKHPAQQQMSQHQMYHPDQLLLHQHQMMDPGNVDHQNGRN